MALASRPSESRCLKDASRQEANSIRLSRLLEANDFAALGLDITAAEDSTSHHGRLHVAVRSGGVLYLFEFNVVEIVRGVR